MQMNCHRRIHQFIKLSLGVYSNIIVRKILLFLNDSIRPFWLGTDLIFCAARCIVI